MTGRDSRQVTYKKLAMRKRRKRAFRTVVTIIVLLGLFALFVYLCQAKEITITGTNKYTAEQVQKDLFPKIYLKNTLWQRVLGLVHKEKSLSYLDAYEIKYNRLNSMKVTVYEKEPVAATTYDGGFASFAKDGTVLALSPERPAQISLIEGLSVTKTQLFEKLCLSDKNTFSMVLNLTKILNKNALVPDRIVFNENNEMELYFGNVTVMLGRDDSIENKISRLVGIMQSVTGRSGILHMENVDENTDKISFIKTKEEDIPVN